MFPARPALDAVERRGAAAFPAAFRRSRRPVRHFTRASRLDDDVGVLDVHQKGFGNIRSFLHFLDQFLAAFNRDRIGAYLESLRSISIAG